MKLLNYRVETKKKELLCKQDPLHPIPLGANLPAFFTYCSKPCNLYILASLQKQLHNIE